MSQPQNYRGIRFWVIGLVLGAGLLARITVVSSSSIEAGRVADTPSGLYVLGGSADPGPAPQIALSIPSMAMDGDRVIFSVSILAGNPVSYQWSFETKSGDRDYAPLNVEDAASPATAAIAYWYSTGHSRCGIDFTSVYTIKAKVTFDDGAQVTRSASFAVKIDKSWGGNVDPPETIGSPEIRYNEKSKQWFVAGPGTLERIPNSLNLSLPSTSQFYQKIVRHEEVHVKQFEDGIFSDLFRIDSLMKWLRKASLSDTEKQGLECKVSVEIASWRQSQEKLMMTRLPAAEREAYDVSDHIEPRYVFQNCGRF